MKIRRMSLYSNNSIVFQTLMEILYSDDSKENIKKKTK